MRLILPILLLTFSVCIPRIIHTEEVAEETIVVVVNKNNPVDNISSSTLARIYKGRVLKWADGEQIVVVDRPVRSETRARFYSEILRTEPTKKFYEPGVPIPFRAIQIRSDEALVAFIRRVRNSVSYVSLSSVDDRVKILKIDGKMYSESGYVLLPGKESTKKKSSLFIP